MAAQFAHREHDIAGPHFGILRIRRMELAAPGGLAEEMAHRGAERRLGEIGQRRRHARDRPHAADIGKRDEQRRFRLHAAQNPHQLRGTPRRRGGVARLAEQCGKFLFRISAEQTKQARRVGFNEIPEIRRRFGDTVEQACQRRMPVDQRLERLAGSGARDARKPFARARPTRRRRMRQGAGQSPD